MNLRITLSTLFVFAFGFVLNAQLSFLTTLDSFPGSRSEFIPLPEGFLNMNASFEDNEDYAFIMNKFDKCGALDWSRKFSSENSFFQGFGSPEAVMDRTGFIYVVLSHGVEQGEGVVLLKISQGGDIEWSQLLFSTQQTGKYTSGNMLYNRFTDTLAITFNNDQDFASIIQFDKDGTILNQKNYPDFRFHSSQMDNDGAIIMVGDTSIIKVDSALELVWAKRLNSTTRFIQSNDPVIELDGQINLVGVDTFGTALDSFYYSLITLDEDGNYVTNSDGIRGVNYGNVDIQERGFNTFMLLDRGLGTLVEGNTAMIASQTNFNFCPDTIPFCSSNMNTCIDNSLLLSGFYYEQSDSITFYMGKTDPMGALNCEEENMPLDTVFRSSIQMDSIHYEALDFNMSIDTVAFEYEEIEPAQEMPCFTAIVEDQSQDYEPCPCDEQPLAVSWLKGAEYLWSTGDSTNFITVDTSGTFTVDVNLCGTEMRSTFNVNYKPLVQCVSFADNSPQCPGLITSLQVVHDYGNQIDINWSTGENGDSIHVTTEGQYVVDLSACGYTGTHVFNIDYRDIEEEDCKPVFIPNAFVPTSTEPSGNNKVFKIWTKLDASAFASFEMQVFDRWGEKVYQTNDPFSGWDGTFRGSNMTPGVYLYVVSYEIDLGGEIFGMTEKGQVVLVR